MVAYKIIGKRKVRKNLEDNTELWFPSATVGEPYKGGLISKIMGRLVFAFDRGEDLFCVSRLKNK